MGILYQPANIHWNYYLAIESDFEKISRYIEFAEANNSAFSIELARIIMASSQEVDGIMKKLCHLLDNTLLAENINHYRANIKANLINLTAEHVYIPRFGMSSQPWLNWNQSEQNPDWWRANNNIKHDRTLHLEDANLKNAFNAVGALLITTLYFYKLDKERRTNTQISWQNFTSELKLKSNLYIVNPNYYHEPGTWGAVEW